MSDPRDTTMAPVRDRDLVPAKRISADPLIVGHLRSVVGHARIIVGSSGSLRREHRQYRYKDSNNHPLDTHVGLPDLGPKWTEMEWERRACATGFHSNER